MQQIPQIVKILLPDRRVEVDGKERGGLAACRLVIHALRLNQPADILLDWIPRQQADHKKDDRADDPNREQRLHQLAEKVGTVDAYQRCWATMQC